ncbi:hypothetical protein MMC30_009304 [Trapelia coarctata]|nr:hypothetical protein [Trapelia coarctata]
MASKKQAKKHQARSLKRAANRARNAAGPLHMQPRIVAETSLKAARAHNNDLANRFAREGLMLPGTTRQIQLRWSKAGRKARYKSKKECHAQGREFTLEDPFKRLSEVDVLAEDVDWRARGGELFSAPRPRGERDVGQAGVGGLV